ncbi:MAG: RidA family protein [Pseudolabrys sp.]|nr:RidA family protein [Pseudolabrys sp.]
MASRGKADAIVAAQIHGAAAARSGQFLFVSAQAGVNPATGRLVQGYDELDVKGRKLASGFMAPDSWAAPMATQCWQTFRNIEAVLAAHGATPRDILRINMYVSDISELPVLNPVRSAFFAPQPPPPITNVEVRWLPIPGSVFQAEVIALLPRGRLKKQTIRSRATSQLVGNYELATRAGSLVVAAGVIAASNRDKRSINTRAQFGVGAPLPAGDMSDHVEEGIEVQTTYLYQDLQRALGEAGGSLRDIVKLTFFLKDLRDLRAVERIHRNFFPGGTEAQPAVTVLTIDELGVHDFLLEIEMIAELGSAKHGASRFLRTADLEPLSRRHPHAARAGGMLWIGGVYGSPGEENSNAVRRALGAAGLAVGATLSAGTSATLNALEGVKRVLAADKLQLKDLAKLAIYATHPGDLAGIEAGVRSVFPRNPPAVTVVGVDALPIPGARVEIEAVARAGRG